jgi:hypothetical protein
VEEVDVGGNMEDVYEAVWKVFWERVDAGKGDIGRRRVKF